MVEVLRDPEVEEAIELALEGFFEVFDKSWQRLCELNGGPPKRMAIKLPFLTKADLWKASEDIIP
jgi:hypothetical protein